MSVIPRMLDYEGLAKYMSVAVQTLRNHRGQIPGRKKLGRKVLFDRQVVDRWLDKNRGVTDLWIDAKRMME